jgi:flagellar hook-basal body complex protein FliE
MPSPINSFPMPVSLTPLSGRPDMASASQPQSTSTFADMLMDQLGHTNALDQSAQLAVERSLSGGDITQVEAFTEMKKADLSLRMMIQIRNKIFDAYNEIKQMQM